MAILIRKALAAIVSQGSSAIRYFDRELSGNSDDTPRAEAAESI
jgi:hypothetical protein